MTTLRAKKEKTKFWKYQSEGNDFIIFSDLKAKKYQSAKAIRNLCNRVAGVGADGIIFMQKASKGWSWKFYNQDGSSAAMCGNGAKCAAHWLRLHGDSRKKSWQWRSSLGEVEAEVGNGDVMWVKWPIKDKAPNKSIVHELGEILDGLNERGLAYIAFIDVGIPHLVLINHETWTATDRGALNEQLRRHPTFGKPGTNVSWHSLGSGESVTYERGVEAETLACGTGAIAIFKALEDMGRGKNLGSRLRFPGGNLLARRDKSQGYWLGGVPREVFSGEVT